MGLFSKGTIELQLKKYSFKPGEEIEGTVRVDLKKPTQGKELTVSFIGQKIDSYMSTKGAMSNSPKVSSSKNTQEVHSFVQPVAGSQEYHKDSYDFSILIPPDILEFPDEGPKVPEGVQNALSAVAALTGGTAHTQSKLKWMIKARLKIPGLDMKKTQDITLIKAQ
jgi:hypothetical protein